MTYYPILDHAPKVATRVRRIGNSGSAGTTTYEGE